MPASVRSYELVVPVGASGSILLCPGGVGWYLSRNLPEEARISLRFGVDERGRVTAEELTVSPVSAAKLRGLPIGKMESALNAPDLADDVARVISHDRGSPPLSERRRRELRASLTRARRQQVVPPLKIPAGGGRKPDAFYSHVARLYSAMSLASDTPAAELARRNGVPVSTIYRWIKEARRRGLMPPGRRAGGQQD